MPRRFWLRPQCRSVFVPQLLRLLLCRFYAIASLKCGDPSRLPGAKLCTFLCRSAAAPHSRSELSKPPAAMIRLMNGGKGCA